MKTYFVDQNWKILPKKPDKNRLGIIEPEDFIDCDYIMKNVNCPKGFIPEHCYTNCPVLAGNDPCEKAIKVRVLKYDLRHLSVEKKRTQQKTLLGVLKKSFNNAISELIQK